MRDGWARGRPAAELDLPTVQRLVASALPAAEATAAMPVSGGLANTNLRVELKGPPGTVLLRIYQRDPGQAGKEAALHRLVEGRVPVPRFLSPPVPDQESGLHFAVIAWMPGERLERVLPVSDATAQAALGRNVGGVLAAIHGFTFPAAGFLAPDLSIALTVAGGSAGLLGFLRRCLVDGPGGARLGAADTASLLAFAEREGHRLEEWERTPCLVHCDFNGSNLLVEGGRVSAVLDWEFAFAGTPAFDFGNLLRPPAGAMASFVDGVAAGYRAAGGYLPPDWRRMAAIADLYAWADFLARPEAGAELVRDATAMVRQIIADR